MCVGGRVPQRNNRQCLKSDFAATLLRFALLEHASPVNNQRSRLRASRAARQSEPWGDAAAASPASRPSSGQQRKRSGECSEVFLGVGWGVQAARGPRLVLLLFARRSVSSWCHHPPQHTHICWCRAQGLGLDGPEWWPGGAEEADHYLEAARADSSSSSSSSSNATPAGVGAWRRAAHECTCAASPLQSRRRRRLQQRQLEVAVPVACTNLPDAGPVAGASVRVVRLSSCSSARLLLRC